MTGEELEAENKALKTSNEFLKLLVEELDRKRRFAWRRYHVSKLISVPKKCPICGGLLIERVNHTNGGYFPGCSNWPICEYNVEKEAKKQKEKPGTYSYVPTKGMTHGSQS